MKNKIRTLAGCLALVLSLNLACAYTDGQKIEAAQSCETEVFRINTYEECKEIASQLAKEKKVSIFNVSALSNVEDSEEYFYSQLSATEKDVYKQILSNMPNTKDGKSSIMIDGSKFDLSDSSVMDIVPGVCFKAIDALRVDRPEFFWIDFSRMVVAQSYREVPITGPELTIELRLYHEMYDNYYVQPDMLNGKAVYTDKASVENAIKAVENAKNECFSQITDSDSDYAKIKKIHDWIANHITYDLSYMDQSMYSAMVNGKAVCAGYTDSFTYLTREAGIDTIKVSGKGKSSATSAEDHAWNYVNIDGKWYGVDVTWDDQTEKATKKIYYDFFMVGSATKSENFGYNVGFAESHVSSNYFSDPEFSFVIPTLNKDKYVESSASKPTETPKPTETTKPTETPIPTETSVPTDVPKPSDEPGNLEPGDVDGEKGVSLNDANLVLRAALGIGENLSDELFAVADVNNDKDVNLTDANYVLKIALGIPVTIV